MRKCNKWFEQEHGELQETSFCSGTLTAFSGRSPAKDTCNEDAAAAIQLSSGHGLLVVADGIGGANAGARAAREIVESLTQSLCELPAGESLRAEIVDAIEKANEEILSWSIGAATTVAVVEYVNGILRTFHVGDSTVLVCSNRGRIKYSTVAHAPIAMAVEIGVMEETEALLHEDRNLINNCAGCPQMKIELGPQLPMARRDTVVVGSDGLFDNLTSDEIVNWIRAGNLSDRSRRLLELAQHRMNDPESEPGKPDDLTFLCFRQ